jgi:peroxiredoxin
VPDYTTSIRIKRSGDLKLKGLIFFLFVALLVAQVTAQSDLTGKKARDFTLKDLAGKKIKMSEHKGKNNVVLFFWTTWCPTCRMVFPKVLDDWKELEDQGIRLILINVGDEEKKVRDYVGSQQIPVPVLLDPKFKVADSYGIYQIPTFVMVDSKGFVRSVSNSLPEDYAQLLK